MSKGLSAEELQATTNAAYVDILYDAYRFRQLQSGTAKAKKKPESPRNVKPKPRRSEPQKIVQKRKLQAARKSGKPESFVDFLLE
jgi:septin family protein